MSNLRNSLPIVLLACASPTFALELRALPEFFRPDPFGGIVESDRAGAAWLSPVHVQAARNGYASLHLVATGTDQGPCRLSLNLPLTADVYREWFHFNVPDGKYYPDALIPVKLPYDFRVADGENRITGQTAQAFWLDVWIPRSAGVSTYRGEVSITNGSKASKLPIEVSVLASVIPDEDAVTLDNNSYGTSWLLDQYPNTLRRVNESGAGEDELFRLIHAHHRIFYEHRGTFHQLGYGHAGKVGPEFAPDLTGIGKNKHVAGWDRFDRHYGPLLDGSAFRDTRRGARPIPYMYLPINPEWPASFLWWGEPGYAAEFGNVVSEMERHFREKNWTHTRLEMFFNQKKRHKGFNWDGDEIRFERDNRYFVEYHRLLENALPKDTPVHFVSRVDTSWTMAHQFEELKGVINFWVTGEGELSWYPDALADLKKRGDTVWTYGGTPAVQHVSSEMTVNPLRSWIAGTDGFVRWQTVAPGPDPWFHLQGGEETLIYPGERFGVAGPLASIRLKLQRDCLQDLALLQQAAVGSNRRAVQEEVVQRFNGSRLSDWSNNTRPELLRRPALEWNNADIEDALRPFEARFQNVQSSAWLRVHEFALKQARTGA